MTPHVVIADHDPKRVNFIREFVKDEYDSEPLICTGWDHLEHELAEAQKKADSKWHIIFLAWNLPGVKTAGRNLLIDKLDDIFAANPTMSEGQVVVLQHPNQSLPPPYDHHSRTHSLTARPGFSDAISLRQLVSQLLSTPEVKVTWPPDDPILSVQLKSMCPDEFNDIRKEVLRSLVLRFRRHCCKIRVKRMTQGYSGSLVLRLDLEYAGAALGVERREDSPRCVLMKVSTERDLWKARRPGDHWERIEKELTRHGLTQYAPKALRPHVPYEETPFLVKFNSFYAEFWQFLGDEAGRFADWDEVYWHEDSSLPTARELLEKSIKLLRKAWYDKAIWSEGRVLWTGDDIHWPTANASPPYGLSAWWKAKILASMAELDRLGKRLRPNTWRADCGAVQSWLTVELPPNCVATTEERVLLSAIHGDLNIGNILWWVDDNRPMLIDFATYQSKAHALQDFANLEAQVKYALMDREHGSKHSALDYSDEQITAWHERLAVLVPDAPREMRTFDQLNSRKKKSSGMNQAEGLIHLIRQQAYNVFDAAVIRSGQSAPAGRFCDEYAAALLFATLKAIGFDNSLSPFKRLLAVQSSARLIARLNQ